MDKESETWLNASERRVWVRLCPAFQTRLYLKRISRGEDDLCSRPGLTLLNWIKSDLLYLMKQLVEQYTLHPIIQLR